MAEDFNQREILDLVRDLIRTTEQGGAQWGTIDGIDEAFALNTPGGLVAVRSLGGRDHPFLFQLYDGSERKLFEMQTEKASFYHASETLIAELFWAARNSVFDVSGTIRNIRDSLGLP